MSIAESMPVVVIPAASSSSSASEGIVTSTGCISPENTRHSHVDRSLQVGRTRLVLELHEKDSPIANDVPQELVVRQNFERGAPSPFHDLSR
jgi:hypothetical protein